jgi:hypothetical protein
MTNSHGIERNTQTVGNLSSGLAPSFSVFSSDQEKGSWAHEVEGREAGSRIRIKPGVG